MDAQKNKKKEGNKNEAKKPIQVLHISKKDTTFSGKEKILDNNLKHRKIADNPHWEKNLSQHEYFPQSRYLNEAITSRTGQKTGIWSPRLVHCHKTGKLSSIQLVLKNATRHAKFQ